MPKRKGVLKKEWEIGRMGEWETMAKGEGRRRDKGTKRRSEATRPPDGAKGDLETKRPKAIVQSYSRAVVRSCGEESQSV